MRLIVLICILFLNPFLDCFAEKLIVAFEPFPPFVTTDGKGLTIDMLRKIESVSDLEFEVRIMTYARAKHELKHHRIDIAGHTPKNSETAEFYQYAIELDWQIQTTSDLFTLDPQLLQAERFKSREIGTTTGNALFFAEQIGVDKALFTEVKTLEQLVDMLIKGRVDILLFERVSVMTLLAQKGVYGVHYQSIGCIPASMAVNNDEQGRALKQKLDSVIGTLDLETLFSRYIDYLDLPASGVTSKPSELSGNPKEK